MSRKVFSFVLVLTLSAAGILLSMNACGGGTSTGTTTPPPPPPPPTTGKIQHIVVIVQENRTPDNLFQDPVLIARGADIATSGVDSTGATIPLTPVDLDTNGATPVNYDLNHAHAGFLKMCDFDTTSGTCKMDGADLVTVFCIQGASN